MTIVADCSWTDKPLPRPLRPTIMAFLAQGEAHGYQIAQHMSEMRMFAGREPDHPGIYRALKEMVDQGLVTSSWETSDSGPAKRVFELTMAGRTCLDTWIVTLCDYRDGINELLCLLRRGKKGREK